MGLNCCYARGGDYAVVLYGVTFWSVQFEDFSLYGQFNLKIHCKKIEGACFVCLLLSKLMLVDDS